MRARAGITVCLATVGSGLLWGQIPTGTLAGSVRDSSGAVVSAATVTIRNAATNHYRDVSTDATGLFTASNLVPGRYEVTVAKPGFRKLRERAVTVELDRATQAGLLLEVGPVTDSVEVPSKAAADDTQSVLDELFPMAL